jgi:hypothetical protein
MESFEDPLEWDIFPKIQSHFSYAKKLVILGNSTAATLIKYLWTKPEFTSSFYTFLNEIEIWVIPSPLRIIIILFYFSEKGKESFGE